MSLTALQYINLTLLKSMVKIISNKRVQDGNIPTRLQGSGRIYLYTGMSKRPPIYYGVIFMKNRTVIIFVVILISALLVAGCTQSNGGQQTPQPTSVQPTSVQQSDTVRIATTQLGKVLVDEKGMTLYYFSRDIPANGTSSCYGSCAALWPIFNVNNIVVSEPLSSGDFSMITRSDGTKQIAYKGWPLYYYQNDAKPGDVNGEGILQVWFVAKPDYSVMIEQKGPLGSYITDSSGRTLYYFLKDTTGTSVCTGSCIATWPAFSADPLILPTLLNNSDFAAVSRTDGVKQIAYMGRPLYYYVNDKKPGDTTGQGFNNLWYVANVSGVVPVITTPATIATTVTPTKKPTTNASDYNTGGSGDSGGGGY